ncbi:hypothetical protein PCANC_26409 [Puccinia coronata f. sp. avenae]|uniref:Uncharacterized protein n=1 Tax=Puccinia coronata f. sp. avenae TaxID=200324 RepID=A0A2N5S880_9BASI|nr:hypothetical protein PCANC_26409 [Puccinia coronata f. sp. avenae]
MYKILRCFKALLLTDLEKKPGNLTTRQVLVEIIQGCFQLDEFLRARPMDGALLGWTVPIVIEPSHPAARQLDCNPDKIQEPLASAHLLLRKFIFGPPNPKKANIVIFFVVTAYISPIILKPAVVRQPSVGRK